MTLGVPTVSKKQFYVKPPALDEPWKQNNLEKAVILVTHTQRENARSTGFYTKVGSEIVACVPLSFIPNRAAAMFATAEFFIKANSKPQFTVKLDPTIFFEIIRDDNEEDEGICLIGIPQSNLPEFADDTGLRDVMHSLPPMPLNKYIDDLPLPGDKCICVGHPYGNRKCKYELIITEITNEGIMLFDRAVPDGCNKAPIFFEGECVALLHQPRTLHPANHAILILETFGSLLNPLPKLRKKRDSVSLPPARIATPELVRTIPPSEIAIIMEALAHGKIEVLIKAQYQLGIAKMHRWVDNNGRGFVHFAAFAGNALSLSALKRQGYDLHATTHTGRSLATLS
jgi:hypothetical protein